MRFNGRVLCTWSYCYLSIKCLFTAICWGMKNSRTASWQRVWWRTFGIECHPHGVGSTIQTQVHNCGLNNEIKKNNKKKPPLWGQGTVRNSVRLQEVSGGSEASWVTIKFLFRLGRLCFWAPFHFIFHFQLPHGNYNWLSRFSWTGFKVTVLGVAQGVRRLGYCLFWSM